MASPDESWNAAAICQALCCPGCLDCRDDDSDATWDATWDGKDEPAAHFWACPKPDCTTPRSEPGDCPACGTTMDEIGADGFEVNP